MSRLQIVLWSALFMLWLAGCTTGFNFWVGVQPAPPPVAHVPCVTVTPTALGGTIPLSATVAITTTDTISLGLPITEGTQSAITATVPATGTPPVSATHPVSPTFQPTLTLTSAPPVSATLPVSGTMQPTVTVTARAPLTGTLTPAPTLRPTQTVTATAPATERPPGPATQTATPSRTPAPGQTPTATRPATSTATRIPPPVPTNTPTGPGATPATPGPTGTAPLTATPRPSPTGGTPPDTPTPAPAGVVFVRSHRGFMQDGAYTVVGEVMNNFGAPVYGVRVTGTFFNSSGQVLATQEVVAMLAQTEAEQRTPFRIQVANAPDDISRYELSVAWDDVSVVTYQDLAVLSQEVRENNGQEVAGEVRNDFTENLGSVVVVVTLYDDAGEVVDAYQGTPQATQLAPNEMSPYIVRIAPPEPFSSASVQAQGKRAIFF